MRLWILIHTYPSFFMIKIKWVKFSSNSLIFILTCNVIVYRFILNISFSNFFKSFKFVHTLLISFIFFNFYVNFIEIFIIFPKLQFLSIFIATRCWNFAGKLWWESTDRRLMIKTNIKVLDSWRLQQNSLWIFFIFSFLI